MQKVLIVFFIVFFVIMVLVFPFKTRAMAHINFLELKCFYSVKIWIVKILCGMANLENDRLNVFNEKTLFSGDFDEKFKTFAKMVLEKIDVKKVELYFSGGFVDNSFSSAIVCGSVLSIVESIYGYLSLKYGDVKMYKDIEPTFKEDNLELTIDFVASISVIGLIIAGIKSKRELKKLKEMYNER